MKYGRITQTNGRKCFAISNDKCYNTISFDYFIDEKVLFYLCISTYFKLGFLEREEIYLLEINVSLRKVKTFFKVF